MAGGILRDVPLLTIMQQHIVEIRNRMTAHRLTLQVLTRALVDSGALNKGDVEKIVNTIIESLPEPEDDLVKMCQDDMVKEVCEILTPFLGSSVPETLN